MQTAAHRQAGFTLVELLTVVSVIAIVTALSAPSFSRMIEAQRVRTAAFDLVTDLLLARSEATKRGGDGEIITITPAEGGWSSGWSVQVVTGSTVLSQHNALAATVQFHDAPGTIAFDRDGRLVADRDLRFSVRGASQSEDEGSCIQFDTTGRAASVKGSCS
ncbi:GspH/FimT family pseudopilin [Caldimonas brevitalea]|uniref:Type II secretion system protein H n=1 Tax=Caldimonas brevitalea TaxID=413882 RepID=A0A0G3BNA9_9BURK|nr:GspH/FimT family pseudopilin [Caldimonas brevitalea]AKJ29478.1 type IV fimbrial biogenesis protein FimT [Caldimonas brevitalea]